MMTSAYLYRTLPTFISSRAIWTKSGQFQLMPFYHLNNLFRQPHHDVYSGSRQLRHIKTTSYSATVNLARSDDNCQPLNRESLIQSRGAAEDDVRKLLQSLLQLNSSQVEAIVMKHDKFENTELDEIRSTYKFLEEKGFSRRHLQRIPWLLLMDPYIMEEKADELRTKLRIKDFRTAASFFQIPQRRLMRIAAIWEKEILNFENDEIYKHKLDVKNERLRADNRIEILAFWLECESHEVSEMMRRTPVLMSSPLESVQAKLNCMLDRGILAKDIIRDPFIFTNVLETIESRISFCKQNGIPLIKPWMLRCTRPTFRLHIQRMTEESDLLSGHEDIKGFLAENLHCTPEVASEILPRVPSIRTATAMKLNEMIQFLLSHGFTTEDILEVPRILGHKVETVKTRISELAALGSTPKSLSTLCYTSTHFQVHLRRLGKSSDPRGLKTN